MNRNNAGSARPGNKAGSRSHTLLLRLWCENGSDGATKGALWRGAVLDLQGQTLGFFASEEELLALVSRVTGTRLPANRNSGT